MSAQLDQAVEAAPTAAAQPDQTGLLASISSTSSASAGPTVTVRETGSMLSTNLGRPSAAGLSMPSPLRWPIVNP